MAAAGAFCGAGGTWGGASGVVGALCGRLAWRGGGILAGVRVWDCRGETVTMRAMRFATPSR
jgi:hypothetical protein